MVDAHSRAGQTRDLVARDEGAASGSYRAKLGHGLAIACHNERLACGHGVNHLRIVVAKVALRDYLAHRHHSGVLERVAATRGLTNYTDLNRALADATGRAPFDFSLERDRVAVGAVLGAVVDRTYDDVGAMLSALVKYMHDNDPGAGFYKLAEQRGWMLRGHDRMTFWTTEVKNVHDYYAAPEFDHYRDR